MLEDKLRYYFNLNQLMDLRLTIEDAAHLDNLLHHVNDTDELVSMQTIIELIPDITEDQADQYFGFLLAFKPRIVQGVFFCDIADHVEYCTEFMKSKETNDFLDAGGFFGFHSMQTIQSN
ncbi:hypothetical protein QTN47_17155 [Danxiaibacter flavus]|uniref:Uncharacterized protein n=1 Tax=Danxiaibacter flavus TaxID=3049108 RepID=A0ABV3ZH63_9BACT|nr:hypothetical protein QNM32_17165 [Chitinophagaceae bacterium DXS]